MNLLFKCCCTVGWEAGCAAGGGESMSGFLRCAAALISDAESPPGITCILFPSKNKNQLEIKFPIASPRTNHNTWAVFSRWWEEHVRTCELDTWWYKNGGWGGSHDCNILLYLKQGTTQTVTYSVLYVLYVCMLWACMYCVLFCVVVLCLLLLLFSFSHFTDVHTWFQSSNHHTWFQSSSHHTCSRSPINPSPLKSPLFVSRGGGVVCGLLDGCWLVVCWLFAGCLLVFFVLSCGRALAELWLFCWFVD